MSYRDDRDALLARNEALERRVGELAAERDEARREAREANERVEELEKALEREVKRTRRGAREGDGEAALRPKLFAWGAFVLLFMILGVGFAVARCGQGQGGEGGSAGERASPPDAQVPGVVDARRAVGTLRSCLTGGDVEARIAIVVSAEERVGEPWGELGEEIRACARRIEALREGGDRVEPAELDRALAAYGEAVANVGAVWDRLARLYASGDAQAEGGAEKVAAVRGDLAEAAGPFFSASRELRRLAKPLQERALAARRAELEGAGPDQRAAFEVALRARELVDAVAAGSPREAASALERYLEAREDEAYEEGDRAASFTRFMREAVGEMEPPGGREAPPVPFSADAAHALHLAVSYFDMAGFARRL